MHVTRLNHDSSNALQNTRPWIMVDDILNKPHCQRTAKTEYAARFN